MKDIWVEKWIFVIDQGRKEMQRVLGRNTLEKQSVDIYYFISFHKGCRGNLFEKAKQGIIFYNTSWLISAPLQT